MGFLRNFGLQMGASTAAGYGMGTAAGAGQAALGLGAQSVLSTIGGDLLTGLSSYQQGIYQSMVSANNAEIARANAEAASAEGNSAEMASRIEFGKLRGEQKVGYAAGGIDVGVGSPKDVAQSTQSVGDYDALAIRYAAARKAYGYGIEAMSEQAQSKLYRTAAGNALLKGGLDATNSFISGSNALAAKYASFGLSGVNKAVI